MAKEAVKENKGLEFDIEREVQSRLGFKPDPKFNNICLGVLNKVEVIENETAKVDANGNVSPNEYAGMSVPKLLFEFQNSKLTKSEPDRFFIHLEGNMVSVKNDGSPNTAIQKNHQPTVENLYNQMWDRIKAIYKAFEGNTGIYQPITTNKEVAKAGKELFANIYSSAAIRIDLFKKFFTAIVNAFNEGGIDGQCIFQNKKEEGVPLWIKLIAEFKEQTKLVFPTYCDHAFVEMRFANVPTTLEIYADETVELQAKVKGKIANRENGAGDPIEDEAAIPDIQALLDKSNKSKK
jgi:hypothetical protein